MLAHIRCILYQLLFYLICACNAILYLHEIKKVFLYLIFSSYLTKVRYILYSCKICVKYF